MGGWVGPVTIRLRQLSCLFSTWLTETAYYRLTDFPLIMYIIMTGFAKRDLIYTSNFATLIIHNFVCDYTITLKVSPVH